MLLEDYLASGIDFLVLDEEQQRRHNNLLHELTKNNIKYYKLDFKDAKTSSDIFNVFIKEMNMPYNSLNWDGFEECINDLAWEGNNNIYILLIYNISSLIYNEVSLFEMLIKILARAIKEWSKSTTLFKVIVYDENTEAIEKAKRIYSSL
jgi:hypothetical protein